MGASNMGSLSAHAFKFLVLAGLASIAQEKSLTIV